MKKKFNFGKLLLKQTETVLTNLTPETLSFDPNLRKVGQGVLELLIGISFGTFDPGDLDL